MAIESGGGPLQDRIEAVELDGGWALILADGAGGMSGGAHAADALVRIVSERVRELGAGADAEALCGVLQQADRELSADPAAGETTAVVAVAAGGKVVGASVGDSGAWLVGPDGHSDLTAGQVRKPLLGSEVAVFYGFTAAFAGTLLVASDGLLKYASAEKVCAAARAGNLRSAAESLLDLARLDSGGLQDDAAVLLCR